MSMKPKMNEEVAKVPLTLVPSPGTDAPPLMENHRPSKRFDIFKGVRDPSGKVRRLKSVGVAYLPEGSRTTTLYLRTFLKDVFYLLPETRDRSRGDFGILTRVLSPNPQRKFLWNNVGRAELLTGENAGLMHLVWDVLGTNDIYMSLEPMVPREDRDFSDK